MKPNGRSLGMGTCRFSCSKEAKAAIAGMDGHMIQGRRQGCLGARPISSKAVPVPLRSHRRGPGAGPSPLGEL